MTISAIQWKTFALSSVMASMLSVTACTNSEEVAPAEGTDTAVATTGAEGQKIRIATEGAYPPFNYTNADGEIIGYDVDIANALCAQMKADCEIVAQEWDGIIPGLMANKYDAIIAGMEVTEERKEAVDFSNSYFETSMVWVAKKDGGFDPAAVSNNNVGGQRATTLGTYISENYEGKDGNTVNLYDTYDNAYLDLKSGRLDAVLAEKAPATTWLKDNPDYGMIGDEISTGGEFAIAMRKGDPLREQFNAALAEIQSNGEFDKIDQTYFGQ